jgi:RNA-directed DNA polymerase
MTWEEYATHFARRAKSGGHNEDYVERCLAYAQPIFQRGFPVIYSLDHLAHLAGFGSDYIRYVAYQPERFYRVFEIAKRAGGQRQICEPLPNLKGIQRWILDSLLSRVPVSGYAKAFVRRRSTRENARFHRRQPQVLKLDISDFFPSLSSAKVRTLFRSLGYSKQVSYFLTRLCTYQGGLPQGAPTSPMISNHLLAEFDEEVWSYCSNHSMRYTRYADDMTFSGDFHPGKLIREIRHLLLKRQLFLSEHKTRLMLPHTRQEVTGVVVNSKLQSPRETRRKLRQVAYFIDRFGLDDHLARINEIRANYVGHLKGLASHVRFLNQDDRDAKNLLEVLTKTR